MAGLNPTTAIVAGSGAILVAAALVSGSPAALAGGGLIAILLFSAAADPPGPPGHPRRRALLRIAAAAAATVVAIVGLAAAFVAGVEPATSPTVALAAAGAVLAVAGVMALLRERHPALEPADRADRTLLLRTAAIGGAVLAAVALAQSVVALADPILAGILAVITALEGVAIGRPGGAGVRRLPTPDERAVVIAAVANGPADAAGYRRIVVRQSGGVERLEVEIVMRAGTPPDRVREVGRLLEAAIQATLEDVAVEVRPRVGDGSRFGANVRAEEPR